MADSHGTWSEDDLVRLFEPYDGINWRALPDGRFVAYVPYANHSPIVVSTQGLAEEIAEALERAFTAGSHAGQTE